MAIADNISRIKNELPSTVKLVAVSKFQPIERVMEAYNAGHKIFGENRPQELKLKAESMPKDIEWHFIGHLQSNKIKMVVPYATLIHSVDTAKLLFEIDNYCSRNGLTANVLLEIYIAQEETKQGFSQEEVMQLLNSLAAGIQTLSCTKICGLMAMASLTDDISKIRSEFANLLSIKAAIDACNYPFLTDFDRLSFGMTNDYRIALEMGTTIVRIGIAIFGSR